MLHEGLGHAVASQAARGLAEHGRELPLGQQPSDAEAGLVGGHGCSIDVLDGAVGSSRAVTPVSPCARTTS
jgi:hypothetical protein